MSTSTRDPYTFWDAMLAGEPADLERNEVVCGRYWKRLQSGNVIGIAIDTLDDAGLTDEGGFEVRIGKGASFTIITKAQIEDFCEGTLSWICRQPVSHEDYAAWWATGRWRDGALIDRKPPKPSRAKKSAAVQEFAAPPAAAAQTDFGGVYLRSYQTFDPPGAAHAFYVRVIARTSTAAEGASVGFYGESRAAAEDKARGWIAGQREKERAAEEAKAARAATRAKTNPKIDGAAA